MKIPCYFSPLRENEPLCMKKKHRNIRFGKGRPCFTNRTTTRPSHAGARGLMSKSEMVVSWVVYRMTIHGKPTGMNAVCEQSEWEAMERAQPGYHTLILAGITNEGEAERLARSS